MNTSTIVVALLTFWLVMGLGFLSKYANVRKKGESRYGAWTSYEGLLFIFDDSQKRTVWMSNMLFSRDIIWIDSQGKVVHIDNSVPPCDTTETKACSRYDSGGKEVKYVLEVTAGFVDKFNITEDSQFEMI